MPGKYIKLSYNLRTDSPNCAEPLAIQPIRSIRNGDDWNVSRVAFINHFGTHLDSPNHFTETGKTLSDFPIEDFIFTQPVLVDIPKQDGELITAADLAACQADQSPCDLLLIRTGFSRYRFAEPDRYLWKTPGLSGDAARFLMAHFPNLRALGIDLNSLEWNHDHSHHFEAHRILLGDPQHSMLILEDVNLDFGDQAPVRVYAFPLFFDELDSSPCTVVAEFDLL
jgi:arylformamidase